MLLLSHKGNEINVNRLQREKESERDRKEREEESDLGYNAMKSIMLYKNHKFFLNQLIDFFQWSIASESEVAKPNQTWNLSFQLSSKNI